MNKDTTKAIRGKLCMEESGYVCFETEKGNGIRICFEFPKESVNGESIVQEVKSILAGELRETMHKAAGQNKAWHREACYCEQSEQ